MCNANGNPAKQISRGRIYLNKKREIEMARSPQKCVTSYSLRNGGDGTWQTDWREDEITNFYSSKIAPPKMKYWALARTFIMLFVLSRDTKCFVIIYLFLLLLIFFFYARARKPPPNIGYRSRPGEKVTRGGSKFLSRKEATKFAEAEAAAGSLYLILKVDVWLFVFSPWFFACQKRNAELSWK